MSRIGRPPETAMGALNPNWRGGKCKHPLYHCYNQMIARCSDPGHRRWTAYGGRGIQVCQRWRDDFWSFVADMGDRPDGHWLDRQDNDGNYEPSNCRWVTPSESNRNRRPSAYDGFRRTTWERRTEAAT